MITLQKARDKEFSIILPKFDNSGNKVRSEIFEGITTDVSNHFGGATIFPSALGCWVNKRKENGKEIDDLICDENMVISAARDLEKWSPDGGDTYPLRDLINSCDIENGNGRRAEACRKLDEMSNEVFVKDENFMRGLATEQRANLGQWSVMRSRQGDTEFKFVDCMGAECDKTRRVEESKIGHAYPSTPADTKKLFARLV